MELIDFAKTDRQRQIVKLCETMTVGKAAKQLGLARSTVWTSYDLVKRRASLRGWSPPHDMTKPCPETHLVRGTSTLYDEDGSLKLQWVKTGLDHDRLTEFARQLADSICQTIKPAKKGKAPKKCDRSKLAVYPIGDAHIGLYCWEEDAEEDFDCKLALSLMTNGFDSVLASTVNAEEALIVNLGDWFHTDTPDNVTRRSGNHLDVDTRWAKVTRVGVQIMRYLVDRALEKHKKVRVINSIGNHDDQTSVMLSMVIDAYYSNEPRLTVDLSPSPFHWYEFGNNLIGVHHGHKCKPESLYRVMSEDQREACGRCAHRYWYTGHIHQNTRADIGGQAIESFRTLSPRDAYLQGAGYRSPRSVCSIVLDRQHGECFRTTVDVEACR